MKYPAHNHVSKLLAALKSSSSANAVVYLSGDTARTRHNTDVDLPFRQESSFFYLTGCNEPGFHILVDLAAQKTTLFVPKISADEAVWIGPPPSTADYLLEYDVSDVRYVDSLQTILEAYNPEAIHVLSLATDALTTLGSFASRATDKVLPDALVKARMIKTDHEIEIMRKANDISSQAHAALFRACGHYSTDLRDKNNSLTLKESERTMEALFRYECHRRGAPGQAYLPIIGSGAHASILHYGKNDALLSSVSDHNPDALLLVDAGCELENYASDITRCVPIANGGRFTDRARTIYQIVLDAQMEVIQRIQPGVQWEDLHHAATRVIAQGLLTAGILCGESVDDCLNAHAHAVFFPHGLGHLIGLDVHDVGGYPNGVPRFTEPGIKYLRMRRVLEPGMVVTVEPGIYFVRQLIDEAKTTNAGKFINFAIVEQYMGVGGVRIEDNVVVTANGYDNLTAVAKTIEDVEKIVASGM